MNHEWDESGFKIVCRRCGYTIPLSRDIDPVQAKAQARACVDLVVGDLQIDVRDSMTYSVDRSVTLKSKDPEHPDNQDIRVSVSGSVSSYKSEAATPRLILQPNIGLTRKQWELAKRLGDQAWNEYEARFSKEPE